ncbi:MAG: alpha-D-ribose 1-methylphosphonate 5-triphosphate diphosphatase [Alphaproteobacteria bacterium]
MEVVWNNARVVAAQEVFAGSVSAVDGRIASLDGGATAAPAVDCEGDYLIPGLIDLHTDHLERHFTPRIGVDWNGFAAALAHDAQIACAGITTVYDSLALIGGRKANNRHETLTPMVEGVTKAHFAGVLRADHRLHLRCEVVEETIVEMFSDYLDNPLLAFMSLMDHSPGQRQFPTLESYRAAHTLLQHLGIDEADKVIAERMEAARKYGPGNRRTLAAIGRARDLPMASHDDQTVEHVDEAAELGMHVAEFPTTLEAARASRDHGMQIVMGAPNLVRGGSHSGNIAAGTLAEHDLLDILSSDYVPISMIQAAFRLTAEPYGFALPKAIATVRANPAAAGRRDARGTIALGLRADMVQVRVVEDIPVVRAVWREGRQVA